MATHDRQEIATGNLRSYVTGYVLSLALTLLAFVPVYMHDQSEHIDFSHSALKFIIIASAITQLFVQAYYFLHLGRESKPRWNLTVFLFMVLVVFIVVFGSLWIMFNLDYHHPKPAGSEERYLIHDEGFKQ